MARVQIPHELNLSSWLTDANCKGLSVKQVTPEVCAGCEVYRECVWTALTADDRVEHGAMFIRGGLTGNARDTIWFKKQYRSNKLGAYKEAIRLSEKVRLDVSVQKVK